jgi:hypothetical protein|tara:strand:- start:702 stop:860 length:159 start_codon:yes stop_codon:yes gene_type:complete
VFPVLFAAKAIDASINISESVAAGVIVNVMPVRSAKDVVVLATVLVVLVWRH